MIESELPFLASDYSGIRLVGQGASAPRRNAPALCEGAKHDGVKS